MPTDLFDREIVINLGGLRIASRDQFTGEQKPILKVQFNIERNLQKDPNSAELTIFNLSKASRSGVQQKGIPVEIEAGYFGNTSLIFKGDLDYGATVRTGTDWVTTLQSTDGGKQYRSARINLSFDAGSAVKDVINRAADELGLGKGNVADELNKGNPRSSAVQYVKGLVLSGQGTASFDKVVRRAGFEWSIQDGQIQLTRPGKVINPGEAVVLNQGTGLIGTPEQGEKGLLKARSLLQPELLPGKRVQIQAGQLGFTALKGQREIDGFFRVEKTIFSGDTWGNDWFSDIEARPVI
jgi:hypothetical protein